MRSPAVRDCYGPATKFPLLAIIAAVAALALPTVSTAASGGPDSFGYTWSDECTFDWIDPVGGTEVTLPDDGYLGPLDIGFEFLFYGRVYDKFYLASNGLISFGSGTSSEINQCSLPNAAEPNNLIALLWTDLDPSALGKVSYFTMGDEPERVLVVTFEDVPFYGSSDRVNAQLALYELSSLINLQVLSTGGRKGSNTTTGIENEDGSVGLTYACNTTDSVQDSSCIMYRYPSSISLLPNEFQGSGRPGDTLTYEIRVQNQTGLDDTFDLTFDSAEWETTVDPTSLDLPNGEQAQLTVSVKIPAEAVLWDLDATTLTVAGQNSGLSAVASIVTLSAGTWVEGPPMPNPHQDHSVVSVEGMLYVIGHNSFTSGVDGIVDVLKENSPMTWESGPEMAMPLALTDAAAIEDVILIPGGFDGEAVQPNLLALVAGGSEWTELAACPEGRYAYGAVVQDGLLYLVGGKDLDRDSTGTLFAYDPQLDSWSSLEGMHVPRSFMFTWALNGKIYVAGGLDASETPLDSAEVYDIAANTWDDTAMSPMPEALWGGGDDVQNGRLLAFGGMGAEGLSPVTLVYDPEEDLWLRIADMAIPRFRFDGAILKGNLYAVGGMIDSSGMATDRVEGMDLSFDDDDDDDDEDDDDEADDDDDDNCGCGC